ncbi:LAQU0S17e00672g1_1 [Lachancea quebecensis]|uniref:LAQU0S17e00672g1_1 n=1 Tax=Lachancea quebecensis TaxID=1654605 RepID=A0A0P1L445_9SACH|nr:LAQU0S17e00672g1_1 [Lachancea quebecensis]
MKILLPLDKHLNSGLESIAISHEDRKFVVFNEDLRVFFKGDNTRIETISVFINEACVYSSNQIAQSTEEHEQDLWELRRSVIADHIFNSNIVMNNGHKNTWRIVVEYRSYPGSSTPRSASNSPDLPELLPSFEPLNAGRVTLASPKKVSMPKLQTAELAYPIHSLLNARLRSVAVHTNQCIFSSLDLQSSKSCHTMTTLYNLPRIRLSVREIDYRIVHNFSSVSVEPLYQLNLPLEMGLWDSYSVNYQLPQTKNLDSHRVRVSLCYVLEVGTYNFVVHTCWETDVNVRKQSAPTALPSQPTSIMSTPMLTPSMKFTSSVNSLVANKLNNVKFKFLTSRVICKKGFRFSLPLQIVNQSQSPLEIVVYCTNSAIQPQGQLPIDKEYQMHKRWMKITEGIVLLSSDHKLPTIPVSETFCANLEFVAIQSGYYHRIPGLKILDLNTQEIMNIGNGVKVLVE